MKFSIKILALLAGTIILVALGVVVSFRAFKQIEDAAEARRQTFVVLDRANELLSELVDAETGQRGYVLTGEEAILQPYLVVRDSISRHLDELRPLTLNDATRKHLDALAPLVVAKMAEMAHVIELRRRHDQTAVLAIVGSGQGKQLMDAIRAKMGSLVQGEEAVLAQRNAEFQANLRRMFALIVAASLLTLLFALSFAWFLYRETRHRFENLVHLETEHLLRIQEETNQHLRQVNATLQASEEKLAVTLNSIGDAVIATNAMGRITLLNPVAEQLTGWTQAEAVGRPVAEIFHIINQETRHPATIPVAETLAQGTIQGLANHTLLIARDGSERAIADSCAPIRDSDGHVVGAVLVFRDVTEEYAAQQALCDSSELIQAVLNTVGDGIITVHAGDSRIETANPAAERMFGYAAAELTGREFRQLAPELDSARQDGSVGYDRARGEAFFVGPGCEFMGRRQDGSMFSVEIAFSEMWLGGRRFYIGVMRDTTARKQIEEEQAQLAQRLRDHQFYTRSLFESNIDALMTTDPSGIITDVNKQMEALTGCTREEMIGTPFKGFFTDPERAEAGIKQVLNEKQVTNFELTACARDGKETVVSYNATTLYDRDLRLQGVFAAARDVTERNCLDQLLQEKNAELESARLVAEKANLAKTEFLSSMSHELRSPLNAILGFAQLLESDVPPPTPGQNKSISQILLAGWHLLKLINEILDLAKIESGQASLSPEPVSLREVILECRDMIEPQGRQQGIRMIIPQFTTPCFVYADRVRVKQVLINLLSNAIKYNRTSGTVEVLCTGSASGRARVSIRDTGAGLDEHQVAQLFQVFNRLGQEASGKEGTGIGLVVAKRLIELMGGVIGVESSVGVGSVFWFELLTVPEPHLSPEGDIAEAAPRSQVARGEQLQTLLYVEDNPANMELIEQLIARHHHIRLLTAVDGYRGVETARASHPDVILMDINLPGIDGFEALNILRSDPDTASIPVIALSANAMPREIEKGRKAGFFRYITKPIKVNEFMAALEEALEYAHRDSL